MTLPALEVGVAVRGDTDQTVQVVGGGRVLVALRGLEPLHILLWNVSKVRLRAKHEQASRPPACEESQPSSRRCAGVPCCRPPPRLTAPPLRRATRRRSRCKQHVAIELPLRHRWDALQDVHISSVSRRRPCPSRTRSGIVVSSCAKLISSTLKLESSSFSSRTRSCHWKPSQCRRRGGK